MNDTIRILKDSRTHAYMQESITPIKKEEDDDDDDDNVKYAANEELYNQNRSNGWGVYRRYVNGTSEAG